MTGIVCSYNYSLSRLIKWSRFPEVDARLFSLIMVCVLTYLGLRHLCCHPFFKNQFQCSCLLLAFLPASWWFLDWSAKDSSCESFHFSPGASDISCLDHKNNVCLSACPSSNIAPFFSPQLWNTVKGKPLPSRYSQPPVSLKALWLCSPPLGPPLPLWTVRFYFWQYFNIFLHFNPQAWNIGLSFWLPTWNTAVNPKITI